MLQYERFEKILQMLQTHPCVKVTELSEALGASESTIRRDITELSKQGRVRKVFGGAAPVSPQEGIGAAGNRRGGQDESEDSMLREDGPAFAYRAVNVTSRNLREKEQLRTAEKTEVASHAAMLIEDGDLVYIDAGTTTGSMIDHIDARGATFVTNGVRHAIRLAARGLNTYLISGRVKAATEAIIGQEAVNALQRYHFSKCFLGTDGIDAENGLTTSDIEESMVKSEAVRRSSDVYILADGSKFGLVASITFADLDIGTIITDHLPVPGYRERTKIVELNDQQE